MKKIININLSGRVIPIEDSAYEKLQAYIESLRRYFAREEGRDEIINDIESRIAELMSEKVRKGAGSITDADVNDIATSMGRPEDFEQEEEVIQSSASFGTGQQASSESFTSASSSGDTVKPRVKQRLYRDTSDKFIGGVCSGIAAYLNVDPAIVRILFAIITFGGFGLGFLAYIILWIVLPPADIEGFSGKRLYRNSEEKMLGGVCSGLAAYFGKNTSTVRLIFLAPIILNIIVNIFQSFNWNGGFVLFPNFVFGSLTGTFVLAYIILWIVLPEARSPYEKMEMRGEKVDVNTIRQTVQDRSKEFSEDVKSAAKNIAGKARVFSETRGKEFASEVHQAVKPVTRGLGHAIGVLFKVFFLFIAGSIAFALFVILMVIISGSAAWWPVNNFLWTSNWQQAYAWGTLFLFLAVPLIGFLVWLIRRIIGVKSRNNYLGWIFGGLWSLGWLAMILLVTSLVKDTRYFEDASAEIAISQPSDKMTLAVSEPVLDYSNRAWWADGDLEGWSLTDDTAKLALVDFTVEKSLDSSYHVTLVKKSAGRTVRDARDRASRITYTVTSKNDILDLGNGFAIDKDSKYRWQMVELIVQVPVGKKIRFDETVTDKLKPVEIRVNNRGGKLRRSRINFDSDSHFEWRSNIDYTMGENGRLYDPAQNQIPEPSRTPGDYRYNDRPAEEKKTTDSVDKGNTQTESLDDNEDNAGLPGSPVFSLVKFIF
jgi:phage shock protein PspC (stress-responsive transcriptional regulator)